jgi:hypothetical protein
MKPVASVACFSTLVIFTVATMTGTQKAEESNFRPRKLQDDSSQNISLPVIAQFNVSIFLELHYLNESVADILEGHHDVSPQPVKDFCQCVKEQVRSYVPCALATSRSLLSSLTPTSPI